MESILKAENAHPWNSMSTQSLAYSFLGYFPNLAQFVLTRMCMGTTTVAV